MSIIYVTDDASKDMLYESASGMYGGCFPLTFHMQHKHSPHASHRNDPSNPGTYLWGRLNISFDFFSLPGESDDSQRQDASTCCRSFLCTRSCSCLSRYCGYSSSYQLFLCSCFVWYRLDSGSFAQLWICSRSISCCLRQLSKHPDCSRRYGICFSHHYAFY
jgi:hypothetical protein